MTAPSGVTVRLATEADTDWLLQGIADQQEYERALHDSRLPGADVAIPYLAHLWAEASQREGMILIAEAGSARVGYVAGWVACDPNVSETPDSNRFGYISDTYVMPAWRGGGIVAVLLSGIEAHFRSTGVCRIRIGLLTSNTSALRAYRKSGFAAYESLLEKRL